MPQIENYNEEMNRQAWSADDYARNARFVSDLGQPAIDLLAPQPGERILDLGCGDGALTTMLAAAGCMIVGVDLSPNFVAASVARGLDVRLADAHQLPFDHEFDAVFSNAALHWMRDIDLVLDGVRRALKPPGRFVGEFGGHGNVAAVCTALRAAFARFGIERRISWYFPTAQEFRAKLEAHGFEVNSSTLLPRPTPLPSGMAAWLQTFTGYLLEDLPERDAEQIKRYALELLRPALCDASGNWTADYTRLRFAAHTR